LASITLTRTSECATQNHITISVTGDATYNWHTTMDGITAPITEADKEAFLRVLLRIARIGRTDAQVRNALTAGYTVTI